MLNLAARIRGIGKRYYIGDTHTEYVTLVDTLAKALKMPYRRARALLRGKTNSATNLTTPFWALQDVNFDVQKGDVLGIIGRNGAGKSTLLKILARITTPTTGRIELRGRVGALLEVGTGFHSELTGRENLFLNGAILGMSRQDIQRQFDEIVDFAGVESFIDTPVKHYSSGMRLRLGFAVAAHLQPEILLIDEVLAVGDAAFQRKCLGKMSEVASQGRTVIFVSHNMLVINQLCSRALLLENGHVVLDSDVPSVVQHYMVTTTPNTDGTADLSTRTDRRGSGDLRFKKIRLLDAQGQPTNTFYTGGSFTIEVQYDAEPALNQQPLQIAIRVDDPLGLAIFAFSTEFMAQPFVVEGKGGQQQVTAKQLPLLEGSYSLHLWAKVGETVQDVISQSIAFEVLAVPGIFSGSIFPKRLRHGMVFVKHHWHPSSPGTDHE